MARLRKDEIADIGQRLQLGTALDLDGAGEGSAPAGTLGLGCSTLRHGGKDKGATTKRESKIGDLNFQFNNSPATLRSAPIFRTDTQCATFFVPFRNPVYCLPGAYRQIGARLTISLNH